MRSLTFLLFFALSLSVRAQMLSWSELNKLPLPPATKPIAYDSGPQQFGELRVPKGAGPFPVIVLIHGGCWQTEFNYEYITRLAAWFTDGGFATWTIEYRRLGDDGGGWPGTFLDVAHATDFVRELAKTQPLDVQRVFAAGHSAGGQLALWLASRGKLPLDSALYVKDPLAIRGVLGFAAITDLAQYRIGPSDSCHASVDPLLGGGPDKVPERYAQTSPSQRLPLGVPQIFVQGERDPIVDPGGVKVYVDAATKAGDRAVFLPIANVGHFETSVPIASTENAFSEALRLLRADAR